MTFGAVPLPLWVPEVVAAIFALQVTLVDAKRRHLRKQNRGLVRTFQIRTKPHDFYQIYTVISLIAVDGDADEF